MIIAKKSTKNIQEKFQDLKTHTDWVLQKAFSIIDNYSIKKVSKFCQIDEEYIKELIFFSCYFHDIGKATKEFQKTISEGKISYHASYSASLLSSFKLTNLGKFQELIIPILISHHRLLKKDKYDTHDKYFNFLKEEGNQFFNAYKDSFNKYLHRTCEYEINLNFSNDFSNDFRDIMEEFRDMDNDETDWLELKVLYCYVSGILNLADWIASAKFEGIMSLNFLFQNNYNIEIIKNKFNFKFKDFQNKLSCLKENVLVEIPTGEGKTEGSILWAINNIINEHTKIIYTLPTQATSNKLFQRITNIFNEKECGLIHSGAKMFIDEYDDNFKDSYEKERHFVKTFNKPVSVCTIDSFLYFLINFNRFNIAFKNYLNSILIIDEIHSYDFKLLGFLKSFLKLAKKLDIKICIMSATLPNKTREFLKIDNYKCIKEESLFDVVANEIIKKEIFLDNDLDFIKDKKDKNIIIIRNTVDLAIQTYEILKKEGKNVILYHSRFKKCDKSKKEAEIFEKLGKNEPFILVATQIVEVSLDINFELMFSDNAPIDALIQRFGRVNRKKLLEKLGKIYIYKTKTSVPYEEKILSLTFNALEDGCHTIKTYNKWLNLVYDEMFKDIKFSNNRLNKNSREGENILNDVLKDTFGICKYLNKYELRDIEIPTKDYILYDDYINKNTNFDHCISLNPAKVKTFVQDNEKFEILSKDSVEYSIEFGLKFRNKE